MLKMWIANVTMALVAGCAVGPGGSTDEVQAVTAAA